MLRLWLHGATRHTVTMVKHPTNRGWPKLVHDDVLEFPNGEGYTPCTREYADLRDKMDVIKPDDVRLDDLSSEDYEEYCQLDNRAAEMLAAGHLGKSVRY